jgi:hypothetical protein
MAGRSESLDLVSVTSESVSSGATPRLSPRKLAPLASARTLAAHPLNAHDTHVAGVACGQGLLYGDVAAVLNTIKHLGESEPVRQQVEGALFKGDLPGAKAAAATAGPTATALPPQDAASAPPAAAAEAVTFECKVCKMTFPTKGKYDKHCDFSASHKENLAKLEAAAAPAAQVVAAPVESKSDIALKELKLLHEDIYLFWRVDIRLNFQICVVDRLNVIVVVITDPEKKLNVAGNVFYLSRDKTTVIMNNTEKIKAGGEAPKEEKFTFNSTTGSLNRKRSSSKVDDARKLRRESIAVKAKFDALFKVVTERCELITNEADPTNVTVKFVEKAGEEGTHVTGVDYVSDDEVRAYAASNALNVRALLEGAAKDVETMNAVLKMWPTEIKPGDDPTNRNTLGELPKNGQFQRKMRSKAASLMVGGAPPMMGSFEEAEGGGGIPEHVGLAPVAAQPTPFVMRKSLSNLSQAHESLRG